MGKIIKVSGPLIVADGMGESKMFDVVKVGKERLIGEIIELRGEFPGTRSWTPICRCR